MPPEITSEQLQIMVGQLSTTTEMAMAAIKDLNDGAKDHDRSITAVMTTLKSIDTMVSDLVKVVHKGNGTESIMSQLAVAKNQRKTLGINLDELKQAYDDLKESLDEEIDARQKAEQEKLKIQLDDNKAESIQNRKNMIALMGALIGAAAGIGAALIALFGT